jgi:hypothetical protein
MNYNTDTDVAIDPEDLLEEWLQLPSLFYQYGRAVAEAEKRVKDAWEVTKQLKAQLKKESGGKNADERESYFRSSKKYQTAKNQQTQAEYERDLTQSALTALYRKEKSIAGAVRLAEQQWWLAPTEAIKIIGGKRLSEYVKEEEKNNAANSRRGRRTRK